MNIKITNEDVVKSCFLNTIARLTAEIREASHRTFHSEIDYEARGVLERMRGLSEVFNKDLNLLLTKLD